MDKDLKRRLKWIEIENNLYILLILNSLINLDANYKLKNNLLNNKKPNEEIRNEYLLASYILLFIFIMYFIRNSDTLEHLEKGSEEYNLARLRVIGSYLLICAQFITVYYFLNTSNFEDSPL